jgi:hypothetical protein
MPIPKLATPKYTTRLHSTGQEIVYRPMLVKEEKILHMATEAQDQGSMVKSLLGIIGSCIETEGIVLSELPSFDVEHLMLLIRSRSVGEVVNPNKKCDSCNAEMSLEGNIDDIEVVTPPDHTNRLQITDDVGIVMKYPSLSDMDLESGKGENLNEMEIGMELTLKCIDQIYDKDNVYNSKDFPKDELEDFVNSLTSSQFQEIIKFFTTSPYIRLDIEGMCPSCGHKNEIRIRGLENFFG